MQDTALFSRDSWQLLHGVYGAARLTSACLVIALLPCGDAVAATGLSALRGLYVVYLYIPALIAALLLMIGLTSKVSSGEPSETLDVLVYIAMACTALFGLGYFSGVGRDFFTAGEAVTTSGVLAVLAAGLVFYFAGEKSKRIHLLALTIGFFLIANIMTPSVVSLRYYTYVDNEPLDNANDSIRLIGHHYIEKSDGGLLFLDKAVYGHARGRALIEKAESSSPTGPDRYRVTVKAPRGGFSGKRRQIYRRDMGAYIKIPLREIRIDNYTTRKIGTGEIVDRTTATNIRFYNASGEECLTDRVIAYLDAGADPDFKPGPRLGGSLFPTPIYKAIYSYCYDIVDRLVEAGADLSMVNARHETPLHFAAPDRSNLVNRHIEPAARRSRWLKIMSRLIQAGSDLNARNKDGDTPLHIAARDRFASTQLLVGAGASVNIRNNAGATPLQAAREYFKRYGSKSEGDRIIAYLDAAAAKQH